ncbi:hypothetical protein D6C78_03925 [Aureobasidium pullulans]|uniref:RING-type domain-containing protein n=1 Tax=Aureobasidium pullulans TaxID=5580 RepID=A0A4T0BVZ2_AURPU|nr:hypothetical protein D6C78_03925 [Aureobasidium pullulans]
MVLAAISSQTDIPLFCTRCIEKQLASSKKPTIEIVWKQRAEGLSSFMDVSKAAHGHRQDQHRGRALLTLRTIRSLFQRVHQSVRSRLHFHRSPQNHTIDNTTIVIPPVSESPGINPPSTPVQSPFAIDTLIMSSVRVTRRATRQLRRREESPLQHALRRSRRVAGERPETGPYQPPPRRPPRQEPAYQELAHPRSPTHPSPPSSDFTFSRPDPPVPDPGFSPNTTLHNLRQHLNTRYPLVDNMSYLRTRRDSASDTRPQSPLAPIKSEEDATLPEEKELERVCDICCEAADAVLQPCRTCPTSYCGDCIRSMFLAATHDSTSMPPRCCNILQTTVALDFLTTTEADDYRLKFEEWVSINKTYCPVPQCSRFIPDRAVLSPPSADPINLWGLLKRELPRIMASLKATDCAKLFRGPSDPAAHGHDWKPSKRPMVWLNDISARLSRYADLNDFMSDFNRLILNARSMPPNHPIAVSGEELRKRMWQEVSNIKARPNSNFSTLPAGACFSCPGCHIGICASCKQVAHFGTPCDTSAQDHEVAMLATYGYKKCPRCGHGVKRMYGCRHMQCRCGAHWCWGCLLPIEDCDGGCAPPSPDSEDGYFSDEDEDEEPDTPTEVMPQAGPNGDTNAGAPTPAAPAPATTFPPAILTSNVSTDAAPSTSFAERPVNLDGGGHRVWEATGADFGGEPDDSYHDPIWSCEHVFYPTQLPEPAFYRGVPLGTECFRCFSRTYATIQRRYPGTPPPLESLEDRYKHTPEADVAWQCANCEMSLCGVCKNDMRWERGL